MKTVTIIISGHTTGYPLIRCNQETDPNAILEKLTRDGTFLMRIATTKLR